MQNLDIASAEKAARLGNSIPFDPVCWSYDPGFDQMVDVVWNIYVYPKLKDQRNRPDEWKTHCKVILTSSTRYIFFTGNDEQFLSMK